MRFVADECCSVAVIGALRDAGNDVLAIAEAHPGLGDRAVVLLANEQSRVLITEDLDFGELAVRHALVGTAVILLRVANADRAMKPERIRSLLQTAGDRIIGHFVVVETKRFRFRRLPELGA